jgi:hypothetical protein
MDQLSQKEHSTFKWEFGLERQELQISLSEGILFLAAGCFNLLAMLVK